MKYSEFREYLTLNKIHLEEDKERLIADAHIEISKTEKHRIVFLIDVIDFQYEFDLIKKAIELAETPLDEREEEKKYYLKHRFISNLAVERYIELSINGQVTIRDRNGKQNNQRIFTKAEIGGLKAEFDTDLNDFEFIEVED